MTAHPALARLPDVGGAGADPYWRLVGAFLVGYPPHSARAYFGDLKAWYAWCASSCVHPLEARRHDVDTWVRYLSEVDQPTTGRPASPASIARRLSCLSKFYDYGIRDAEILEHSPVAAFAGPRSARTRPPWASPPTSSTDSSRPPKRRTLDRRRS